MRKNCDSDWEKLLKIEAEGREFEKKIAKILGSLEQFVRTVKGQNKFMFSKNATKIKEISIFIDVTLCKRQI